IPQRFVPVDPRQSGAVVYQPRLIATGDVTLSDARLGIDERRPFLFAVEVDDDAAAVDWADAEAVPFMLKDLADEPIDGARFAACPAVLTKPQQIAAAEK